MARKTNTGGTRRPYNGPKQTADFINGAKGNGNGKGGAGGKSS